MMVNLFLAVVLEGFLKINDENQGVVTAEHFDTLLDLWGDYDPDATGWIKPQEIVFLLYELPAPLGKNDEY
eukprot:CAMPEP_0176348518 /NCGR_PEP_ID=MMETSP0126-20121128/7929_1 /TAXON_ID=141414 ORGANISM="Strombidinopsis acuminatum, Strain SPMC142" /NCGR_SAMPLE_ID=MMETSP0126 /ASSEMBLY_ACC=CAM_ASM_000229 /LENGTH=70 /DNA_ID=CAMNT_0017697357 /DNA_START=1236 /DNA_END=1448 /DNA_ORIENTATION=+